MGFFYNHRKILIIIGVFIAAFIIYRYFWQKKDITQDLKLKNVKRNLDEVENAINGRVQSLSKENSGCNCLDPEVQRKIAEEIDKKLQEIDTCNCNDICALRSNRDFTH